MLSTYTNRRYHKQSDYQESLSPAPHIMRKRSIHDLSESPTSDLYQWHKQSEHSDSVDGGSISKRTRTIEKTRHDEDVAIRWKPRSAFRMDTDEHTVWLDIQIYLQVHVAIINPYPAASELQEFWVKHAQSMESPSAHASSTMNRKVQNERSHFMSAITNIPIALIYKLPTEDKEACATTVRDLLRNERFLCPESARLLPVRTNSSLFYFLLRVLIAMPRSQNGTLLPQSLLLSLKNDCLIQKQVLDIKSHPFAVK